MAADKMVTVRPKSIDDLLINPGVGFMTFQRFNGDALNEGKAWTEGFPIEYQAYSGSLENKDHPSTSIAYFRIYWRFLAPERDQYSWDVIDKALATARSRKQTLMPKEWEPNINRWLKLRDSVRQQPSDCLRGCPEKP